ncbi:hypothetical protein FJW06_02530 [Mesorhizobium sp. B4-1-3]|nr:hypothetical protein FJW06_02530 [Mesorhizobium sp. B4-1-3]
MRSTGSRLRHLAECRPRRPTGPRFNACRPKSAQRFWKNDMHQNKDLKRVARIPFSATRFRAVLRAVRALCSGRRRRCPGSAHARRRQRKRY